MYLKKQETIIIDLEYEYNTQTVINVFRMMRIYNIFAKREADKKAVGIQH